MSEVPLYSSRFSLLGEWGVEGGQREEGGGGNGGGGGGKRAPLNQHI